MKKLAWIRNKTGNEYIDTNFMPNQDTRVVMSVYNAEQNSYFFNSWSQGWNTLNYSLINDYDYSSQKMFSAYGNQTTNFSIIKNAVIDFNKNVVKFNDVVAYTYNYVEFQSLYSMYLFAQNRKGSATLPNSLGSFCLEYCKIYNNDVLIKDFIPVLDDNDIPCLYEQVEQEYYYNKGSGAFSYSESNYKLIQQSENSSNGATSCSLTMDNCTLGNTLILAYAIRGSGNEPTLSDGWEKIGGGNNEASSSLAHKLYFAKKKVESITETITLTQTTTGRIYLVCGEFSGKFNIVMRKDMANIGNGDYKVTANKSNANDVILYGVTSSLYQTGTGRMQVCDPSDLTKLQGDNTEERLACWFDDGSGSLSHEFTTSNSSGSANIAIVECVQLVNALYYLIRNNGTIYTVQNGTLMEVSGTLNAQLFINNGSDTIPDGALLMTLSAPEVLCWADASDVPRLNAVVQGVPTGTHDIIGDNVSVGHSSIYGITSVEATASDGATVLLSFDGGMWMAYNNGEWSASDVGMTASELMAIPTEAWSSVINSAQTMRLKVSLDGVDTVTQIKFNFNNTPPV
jgi:hypothetical protein